MGGVIALMGVAFLFSMYGLAMWTDSDGYAERVRHRKALNRLELEKARRAAEIELKTLEWQGTATLEDLTEHRLRLKGELDNLHREQSQSEGGDRHV